MESHEELILFATHITDRTIEYASTSFTTLLGYTNEEFIAAGPDLLFSMAEESSIPGIVQMQQGYIKHAKSIGFKPTEVGVMEFKPIPLRARSGNMMVTTSFCIVLSYSPACDFDFGIVLMAETNDPQLNFYQKQLQKIKERHNKIYTHKPMKPDASPLELVHVKTQRLDMEITCREKEILALLAKGFSTKKMADELQMSTHTAETHRKNLLTKFEAKNFGREDLQE